MILRRTYEFGDWATWDDAVHRAARDFRSRFLLWPNILLASRKSYFRIDLEVANSDQRENVASAEGEPLPAGEFAEISSFTCRSSRGSRVSGDPADACGDGPAAFPSSCSPGGGGLQGILPGFGADESPPEVDGYTLDFCIRDDLPPGRFLLVFDTDPGGGGEPFPEEDTEPFLERPRVANGVPRPRARRLPGPSRSPAAYSRGSS